jgi:hypothetical protein
MPPVGGARRRRCRVTTPAARRNKGRFYPADPPTVEEIVAVMRQAGEDRHSFSCAR